MNTPEPIPFSVDAALLRELGKRLVGRADIAVAELVKNSYDADANLVRIQIEKNRIIVEDNGHGMTEPEFLNFWMRIGSPHKVKQEFSKKLNRPLTGSKGVGRLAVQFLGTNVEVVTASVVPGSKELRATVDWTQAEQHKDLTQVVALLTRGNAPRDFVSSSTHGTRITITGLSHDWSDSENAERLASEIWQLRSPEPLGTERTRDSFEIELESSMSRVREKFATRLTAPLDIWYALIRGKLVCRRNSPEEANLEVELRFRDQPESHQEVFPIPDCPLHRLDFEIRVYTLYGRQPAGIAVKNARDYMERHGGVKVYDNRFRLPYYGLENDWLGIEVEHSHRRGESKFLPHALHVAGGMSNLPTQTRLLGYVYVDTRYEAIQSTRRSKSIDYLQIQVTRDRLVDNRAYKALVIYGFPH